MSSAGTPAPAELAELSQEQREVAWARWQVLASTVQDAAPLTRSARAAGVPVRTAQRWLRDYRAGGLTALARRPRADRGHRRVPPELVALVEGLALRTPALSMATITRRAAQAAAEHGWAAPSYSTVRAVATALDPAIVALAHDGPAAFRDRFELVYRRLATHRNDVWQADHTQLDIIVLDSDGQPVRPWLTVILDDHSRAVAGCTVFLGAPSTLNLSLALRQAIWAKPDPRWVVHGIPDVLHVHHGSDFTSHHLAQARASRPPLSTQR